MVCHYCLDSCFAHFVFVMVGVQFILSLRGVLLEFDFYDLARRGNGFEPRLYLLRVLVIASEKEIQIVGQFLQVMNPFESKVATMFS